MQNYVTPSLSLSWYLHAPLTCARNGTTMAWEGNDIPKVNQLLIV